MRLLHVLAVCVTMLGLLWTAPASLLTDSLQNLRNDWFGPSAYQPRPAARQVQNYTLDEALICPPEHASWRKAREIDGVQVESTEDCQPDNPWDVAVAVKGSNNVSMSTLHQSLLAQDAIEKSDDRDGDGDPDLIEIRLEVMELNGSSPDLSVPTPEYAIAPGVTPGFWIFVPKTRGMTTENFESNIANRLMRMPGPAIRVEQGDEIRITLENTHYLPHTIHFHGVDHPFKNPAGEGNDGVPLFSEAPVMPGEQKTYWLQPRQAGTMFYHCHVQPQAHILMGLQGLFVIEENRPNNWLQTVNVGAGRVRVPSRASKEKFDREFDLHYLEIDSGLNNQIQHFDDPRLISKAVHRRYNVTRRQADYFTLNGRSFPYTMQDSLLIMEQDKRYKLRVLNGGGEGLALHIHGHKPTLTHRDGVALGEHQRIQRDVFWIASAQRLDLEIDTTNDGLNSYGSGTWLMHDHREPAVTTNGIGPGGGVSLLVYKNYLTNGGLPQTVMGLRGLAPFFSPDYYQGEVPVFAHMGDGSMTDPGNDTTNSRGNLFWVFFLALIVLILLTGKIWRVTEQS
ncbi:MAG: multicopper oxidase domain-containing protein [Gammaproteobacteria bacterium]